jgi:hypothetical protein
LSTYIALLSFTDSSIRSKEGFWRINLGVAAMEAGIEEAVEEIGGTQSGGVESGGDLESFGMKAK